MLKDSPAGKLLFKNFIRKDVTVKNAMDKGQTVFEIKPDGMASRDFTNLTNEILSKITDYEQK
jgi:cellulose biosynthesis protein BcsQ